MKPETQARCRRWAFLAAALLAAFGGRRLLPPPEVSSKLPIKIVLPVTASGPFRAVAINTLWLRANRLQEEGKFFELNDLCRAITALEPRLPKVWAFWAWNLAYNISVKFPANRPDERWRWVSNGIRVLRDRGIPWNPRAPLLYRELAWLYDHKIGGTSDEAHVYYKVALTRLMHDPLGHAPQHDRLGEIAADPEELDRFHERFKLSPRTMLDHMDRHGPIDWRLPDGHTLYWASAGLDLLAPGHPRAANHYRLVSHALANFYERGRLRYVQATEGKPAEWTVSPHFAFIERTIQQFDETLRQHAQQGRRAPTHEGHLNFLRDVVLLLYIHNDVPRAQHYFARLKRLGGETGTFGDFIIWRFGEHLEAATPDRARSVIHGVLFRSLWMASVGDSDMAAGLERVAARLWEHYLEKAPPRYRAAFPTLREIWRSALRDVLRACRPFQRDKLRELFPDEVANALRQLEQPPREQ